MKSQRSTRISLLVLVISASLLSGWKSKQKAPDARSQQVEQKHQQQTQQLQQKHTAQQ